MPSLTYSWKANGWLCMCLYPRDMNLTTKWDHYGTPTLEEVTHWLVGSTCFTKLDVNLTVPIYYPWLQVILADNFQHTMGIIPFCLPSLGPGLCKDILQCMMDQILSHCDGAVGSADDDVIHGKEDEGHDRCLCKWIVVVCEHSLLVTSRKCTVKKPSVTFFECVYEKEGTHLEPAKVSVVHSMPPLETLTQLQKFLGIEKYLWSFVPSLSSFTAPLHELLLKDIEWTWNQSYEKAFDTMKCLVYTNATLRYFDVHMPITFQVDVSWKGLGATLIKDDHPVACG